MKGQDMPVFVGPIRDAVSPMGGAVAFPSAQVSPATAHSAQSQRFHLKQTPEGIASG
jgi:hypothetical protein